MIGTDSVTFTPALGLAKTVLVVLADAQLRQLLCAQLSRCGVLSVSASSVTEAEGLLQEFRPDALLMDIDGDRRSFDNLLKGCGSGSPVPSAMLTSNVFERCGSQKEICGADYCVPKPVHPGSLIRSVISLLEGRQAEHVQPAGQGRIRRGLLTLDLKEELVQVFIGGRDQIVDVAPRDFRLLSFLMTRPDTNHARSGLLNEVWPGNEIDERTVDASIMRLRKRLRRVGLDGAIVTVPGKGYRFSTLFASTSARALS